MRTVVVTGASRGLGLAIAQILVQSGYRVVAASRTRSASLDALVAETTEGMLVWEQLDLENHPSIHPFVKAVAVRYGALYGLVNNAAIGLDGVLATQHEKDIVRLVNTNVTGSILLTKYAVRTMLSRREGRIVSISSIAAVTGFNGLSVYSATKAAMNGFSGALARELGPIGITVNCVAPGFLETEMTSGLQGEKLESIRRRTPRGKLPTLKEVAVAVKFLLDPEAGGITGTTLKVDAGSTA